MAHTMPSPTTAAEATCLLGSCSGSQSPTSAPAQCLKGGPARAGDLWLQQSIAGTLPGHPTQ